jgi:two-component system, LytTR family, response regulator
MSKIKCVVLDDEPLALALVCDYVSKVNDLELVHSSNDSLEMLDFIQKNEVDIAFLDIEMPNLTGTALAKIIQGKCKVVFITAYHQFALEGYDLAVIDYLLKPVTLARFLQTVQKIQAHFHTAILNIQNTESSNSTLKSVDSIFIKSENAHIKINFKDLLYVQGYGDYVKFFVSDQQILSLMNLKDLESLLPLDQFIRVHKSYIVSLEKITLVTKTNLEIGSISIPISDSYKNDVFEKLKIGK